MLAWTVVKKFVHAFLQNKSNDMAPNFGVFIRSSKSNDEIIEACTNLIRNSESGGRITAVSKDKTYGGVKVYFNGEGIVKELLGKQFLYETGDDLSTIYPLTTQLTVHDAIISTTEEEEEKEFIAELRKIFEEALGPVLEVSKIPASKLHPDIGSGNWRVLLDIPEIEDLDIHKKSGLPDDFTIKIPGVHGRISVTFHCTKCDQDGHTQWRCSEGNENEVKPVPSSLEENDSTSEIPCRPMTGFFIRDRDEENSERDSTPKNKPLLKRKNIREFESEIGQEEVRNYCDSFHVKNSSEIKREVGESSSSGMIHPVVSEGDGRKSEPLPKKARSNSDERHSENLPKASSTTYDADSVEIVYDTSFSTPSKTLPHYFPSESVRGLLFGNSVDDSVSTSNQPAPTVDTVKSELPSTDENESDSNHAPNASLTKPIRQRKKPAQSVPVVIPDRIKKIISEIDGGLLGVDQLTAFFNHVKKKAKPCKIAEIYTPNVSGLKAQLAEIQKRFYMTPERGTNKELQFMKWFDTIIVRFDGTPSTRRQKTTA